MVRRLERVRIPALLEGTKIVMPRPFNSTRSGWIEAIVNSSTMPPRRQHLSVDQRHGLGLGPDDSSERDLPHPGSPLLRREVRRLARPRGFRLSAHRRGRVGPLVGPPSRGAGRFSTTRAVCGVAGLFGPRPAWETRSGADPFGWITAGGEAPRRSPFRFDLGFGFGISRKSQPAPVSAARQRMGVASAESNSPAAARRTTAAARIGRGRRARLSITHGEAPVLRPSRRAVDLRALQGFVDQAHGELPSSSRIARRTCASVSRSLP